MSGIWGGNRLHREPGCGSSFSAIGEKNAESWNGCPHRKVSYSCRKKAKSAAARLANIKNFRGPNIAPQEYRCPHCGDWHIGRPGKRLHGRNKNGEVK